jgi:hypothetical protein
MDSVPNPASNQQVTDLNRAPDADKIILGPDARLLVDQAVAAIKAFAGDEVRRPSVLNILKRWQNFDTLNRIEVHAVLNSFPPPAPPSNERECKG